MSHHTWASLVRVQELEGEVWGTAPADDVWNLKRSALLFLFFPFWLCFRRVQASAHKPAMGLLQQEPDREWKITGEWRPALHLCKGRAISSQHGRDNPRYALVTSSLTSFAALLSEDWMHVLSQLGKPIYFHFAVDVCRARCFEKEK